MSHVWSGFEALKLTFCVWFLELLALMHFLQPEKFDLSEGHFDLEGTLHSDI